jgi:lamin tail-like protein
VAGVLAGMGAAALGCSDLPAPPIGQLQLGLASGIGEAQFKLTHANFSISGDAQLELSSEDDPASDSLQRALPVGQYSVELLAGWQLERVGPSGASAVAAELSSNNPLEFSISAGDLTTLTFQFRTLGGGTTATGDGQVRLDIEVDGTSSPHLVISEFMKNPEVLPDAQGEWLELHNAGSQPVDLGGCTLARDDQELALDGGISIEPGGYMTFSNGEMPGFDADVLYRGITLPNSGGFVLRLACAEQLLDEVGLNAVAVPSRAGHSLSLSGSAMDGASNDLAQNWCEGTSAYNGDLGTPGSANPDCPP